MINRRKFIRNSAVGITGLTIAGQAKAGSPTTSAANKEVISRNLGQTGIKVAVLGMGVGRCDSPAVVKAAIQLGVTHFDTAHRYQKGNSERMLGEVLKEYDPIKRMVYQGRGMKVRALFDQEDLPRREQAIRNTIKRNGFWMR